MAFNPYYDKKDRALIDAWQNLTNFKFNFSDPNGEQQIINILFLTKGFLIMTLLEQTLLTQLEEKEKWEQDMVMLLGQLLMEFKTLKEKLVSIETESTNNINSLYQELSNLQLQLTNLQKESENQTFFQENYMMQLENLKKSLEGMH